MKRIVIAVSLLFATQELFAQSDLWNSRTNGVRVLRAGTFHGDEVLARSGEKWLALAYDDHGWQLVPTTVEIHIVRDFIADKEKTDSGKEVSFAPSIDADVYLRGGGLHAGPVTPASDSEFTAGNPEATLELGRRRYALSMHCEEDKALDRCLCSIELTEGSKHQTLMTLDAFYRDGKVKFPGSGPELVWSGDLNGDGDIDLILAIEGENSSDVCVFMSDVTGRSFARTMSCFVTVGC